MDPLLLKFNKFNIQKSKIKVLFFTERKSFNLICDTKPTNISNQYLDTKKMIMPVSVSKIDIDC